MSSVRETEKANVVVVTHNSAPTVRRLFEGLRRQPEWLAQVVVVDNGSVDETVALVETEACRSPFPVDIVRSDNCGFAGGYVRGGAALLAELPTLCLNPDVELAEGVLDLMMRALHEHPEVGVVTAPLNLPNGETDPSAERRLPVLSSSLLYSLLGKLTPSRFRYNRVVARTTGPVRLIEATTGALMLVRPEFRRGSAGIFDTDYWMYGEDLQLCADAKREGWAVARVDAPSSLHVKGTSSGLPRSRRSNVAFHRAMYLYYRKNLDRGRMVRALVWCGVHLRLAANLLLSAVIVRLRLA